MIEHLTDMQKRYIWLAGSFPDLLVEQGQGRRRPPLWYALTEDAVVIFGYSDPLYFLEHRGFFRRAQDRRFYILTEKGEDVFRKMLVVGDGAWPNKEVREVRLKRAA